MNRLYFGDCLDVLKELTREHPEGFIDLVYIDPPFNSKRNYNVLFESIDMKDAKAQKEAFADTWSNVSYLDTLNELQDLDLDLYNLLTTLDRIRISKGAVSYLTTMAIRIYYIHKVLKDTGSFYLHCDPTMSHYLKVVCDIIFIEKNFRNEIVWKRTTAHNDPGRYGANIDIILFYTKTDKWQWNDLYRQHDENYLARFKHKDSNGRLWQDDNLSAKGLRGGGYEYEYKGTRSLWRVPLSTMQKLDSEGKLHFTNKGGIRLKRYLDENKGIVLQALWDDISPINSQAKERLGYPTQKPEELLERIVKASSNEGDLVADFFCGCGTSIAVAQKLKRNWLGVDISHLAIKLIVDRLTKPYQKQRAKAIRDNIHIAGFPKDIASAKELASNTEAGCFGFQDWVVEVMLGGVVNPKKVADGGYDGYLSFFKTEKTKGVILVEVKSGKVNVKNLREFIHVVETQQSDLGVFVCFSEQVTKPMQHEAKTQGYFENEHYPQKFDKIQIITVEDLLEGKDIHLPSEFFVRDTFKAAKKKLDADDEQGHLFP